MFTHEINSIVLDHQLKHKKLVFELSVKKHTTPASKVHSSDLSGVCFIATEGKLTDVSAIEDITGLTNYSAPSDGNGIFDVLLKGSELGSIKKVLSCEVVEKTSTGFSSPTIQMLGTSSGLTAGGNIAFEIDTATDLSADTTTTVKFVVEIDYLLSE